MKLSSQYSDLSLQHSQFNEQTEKSMQELQVLQRKSKDTPTTQHMSIERLNEEERVSAQLTESKRLLVDELEVFWKKKTFSILTTN